MYGKEVIIDLGDCNVKKFKRSSLRKYFKKLCKLIDMVRDELYFWDDKDVPKKYRQTEAHTKGISAVQFILTSTIVIHTLELREDAYVNIFSCKAFDREIAETITVEWFGAKQINSHFIERI